MAPSALPWALRLSCGHLVVSCGKEPSVLESLLWFGAAPGSVLTVGPLGVGTPRASSPPPSTGHPTPRAAPHLPRPVPAPHPLQTLSCPPRSTTPAWRSPGVNQTLGPTCTSSRARPAGVPLWVSSCFLGKVTFNGRAVCHKGYPRAHTWSAPPHLCQPHSQGPAWRGGTLRHLPPGPSAPLTPHICPTAKSGPLPVEPVHAAFVQLPTGGPRGVQQSVSDPPPTACLLAPRRPHLGFPWK